MSEQVWISGGQGALGQALARAFRVRGNAVLAPGREELDVADSDSVERFFAQRDATPGLFIANAGIAENRLLGRLDEGSWVRHFQTNLDGAFRCARRVARGMLHRRAGHLVFISSHAALHPAAGQSAYAASKAGLIGFALSLARELGPAGIRVNVVLPGFMDTPMTHGLSPARREAVDREQVLGRGNTPKSVASFLAHLHHEMPHTSGQIFRLDSRIG